MFGQNEINHKHAMRIYHAMYCNRAYRAAVNAYMTAGAGRKTGRLLDYQYGIFLSDAGLECCGHENYTGAVSVLMAIAANDGKACLSAALLFLEKFATIEHIANLDQCKRVGK